jgi:predicted  nucleic acid-binding Zn-ribbon protein
MFFIVGIFQKQEKINDLKREVITLKTEKKNLEKSLEDTKRIGKKLWAQRVIKTKSPYSARELLIFLAEDLKEKNATVEIHLD